MDHQENVNHGSGQSVNVSMGYGPTAIIIAFLVVVMLAMLWSVKASSEAQREAKEAKDALKIYTAEKRYSASWMEGAYVACTNAGVKLQPIPAVLK